MPHLDSNEIIQHVTFRLADSLPTDVVKQLISEIEQLPPNKQDAEKRWRLEALADAGHGACWLRRPDCAHIVQNALLHFDGQRYQLIAWVVMPNHVHVLFQPINGWRIGQIVGSWKTYTANAIGAIVREPRQPMPRVWYPEYWDRYIRDEMHFASAIDYIHNNPVKAQLVTRAEEWPWRSANPNSGTAGAPNPQEWG